jgi:hypothetical protein
MKVSPKNFSYISFTYLWPACVPGNPISAADITGRTENDPGRRDQLTMLVMKTMKKKILKKKYFGNLGNLPLLQQRFLLHFILIVGTKRNQALGPLMAMLYMTDIQRLHLSTNLTSSVQFSIAFLCMDHHTFHLLAP